MNNKRFFIYSFLLSISLLIGVLLLGILIKPVQASPSSSDYLQQILVWWSAFPVMHNLIGFTHCQVEMS